MARNVHVAEDSLECLLKTVKGVHFQFGLLIGQLVHTGTAKEVHIVHWCPTPTPEDEAPPDNITLLNTDVVAHHAAQVARMLPGGINVLGAYVCYPNALSGSAADSSKMTKLRGMLSSIFGHTVVPNTVNLGIKPSDEQTKMIVITLCSKSLKYVCQRFLCTAAGALPETVHVEMEKNNASWREISFSYSLDLTLYTTSGQGKESTSLHTQLMNELGPWASNVHNSCVLLEEQLCSVDDARPLVEVCPEEGVNMTCRILVHSSDSDSISCNKSCDASTTFTMSGTMAGIAFLHPANTVGAAVSAVTDDVVRSAVSRWTLHCDSLVGEESEAGSTVLHELPRRVLLRGAPGLPVCACDYMFPGDTTADARLSARELLGLTVPEGGVEEDAETWSTGISECSSESSLLGCSSSPSGDWSPTLRPRHLLAAAMAALCAMLIAYLCLSFTK